MGSAVGVLFFGSDNTYIVDDKPEGHVIGFAKQIFVNFEWQTLKVFCNTYEVHQHHLVTLFKTYLSNEEVYLREFRVKVIDVKMKFLPHSKLLQELADTFMPAVLMKTFKGLDKATQTDEVTFARLAIMGYIFCAQQIPDLIYEFFATLRQKMNLQIQAVFFYYNVEQLILYLVEDITPSTSLALILKCISKEMKDKEIPLLSIIKLGIKYPILFYSLERYRRYMKRFIFGDKFWQGRKNFKLKIKIEESILQHVSLDQIDLRYQTEKIALQYTARALITDAINGTTGQIFKLSEKFLPHLTSLNEEDCLILKDMLGYKAAGRIIEESGLETVNFVPLFMPRYVELEHREHTEPDVLSVINNSNSSKISRSKSIRSMQLDSDDDEDDLSYDDNSVNEDENRKQLEALLMAEKNKSQQLIASNTNSARNFDKLSPQHSEKRLSEGGGSMSKQNTEKALTPHSSPSMKMQQHEGGMSPFNMLSQLNSMRNLKIGNTSFKAAAVVVSEDEEVLSPQMSNKVDNAFVPSTSLKYPTRVYSTKSMQSSPQPSAIPSAIQSPYDTANHSYVSPEGSQKLNIVSAQSSISKLSVDTPGQLSSSASFSRGTSSRQMSRKARAKHEKALRKAALMDAVDNDPAPPPPVVTQFTSNGCEVILDKGKDRYFMYDIRSGKRAWSQLFINSHGEVVKQSWTYR